MRRVQPQSRKKNTTIAPRRRPYHVADDPEIPFEYDLPDWA